ncbi:hypothetical protein [Mycoplasmopsis canis]|uniref:hypothetical protein n=1 Tax=Mycoplasmopsis canis TaxID=29555 RepID=UPI0002E3F7CF|nr:hypothetical protein [Mycoplasmopsis canis]
MLQNGSRDRKIKVQLFGNLLIQDLKRLTRISGQEKGYSFEFDFERMRKGETLTATSQT